ncbi:hypothetical protein E2C01_099827 [Portunus trituberculatus]|uniref:Uncharacterized protein n=1 Tax=Portunus trituberculatus TaxID=210409 RepID=A0A5B7KBQ6_PORTR|nr:hypothetical protein [Portunus trituberculatus]
MHGVWTSAFSFAETSVYARGTGTKQFHVLARYHCSPGMCTVSSTFAPRSASSLQERLDKTAPNI